jgi:hypothetical protein
MPDDHSLARPAPMALVMTRSSGFPQSLPERYADFVRYANASPNRSGYMPGSFAWRSRNRPAALDCRMAFAVADDDFLPFDPRLLDGSQSIVTARSYGAARRRTMLWARRLLTRTVLLSFVPNQPRGTPWRHFAKTGVVELGKFEDIASRVVPAAQLRLLAAIERHRSLSGDEPPHAELERLLRLPAIFDGMPFKPPPARFRAPRGSRLMDRAVVCLAFISADRQAGLSGSQGAPAPAVDEWDAWPVSLPPAPFDPAADSALVEGRKFEQQGNQVEVSLVVRRRGLPLDEEALARFTRAFEHAAAHVCLLQHCRLFVEDWWEPLLNPPSWRDKERAAGNFLRAWQHHSRRIEPLWALAANDPHCDPHIVQAIDRALQLTAGWQNVNRRLADLVRLSMQVLKDGDQSIHLNSGD